jgi:hypothetical protein
LRTPASKSHETTPIQEARDVRQTDAPRPAALRRWLPITLVALVLLAACASAGSSPGAHAPLAEEPAGAPAPAGDAADEDGGTARQGTDAFAAPIEQRIIKTGEITIQVENVGEALGSVRALALDLGGYVGGSQAGTLDDAATLTLRIPADRFEDALVRLHQIDGEVLAEATREEDVTSQIVDLEARIANLRASEESYRTLLDRAERIEDVLAVQTRLDQVRGEIEQLTAQLENVSGQADLSTLTVTLTPQAAPASVQTRAWDPGAELSEALASLVGIGQGLASAVIWFVVVWVPVLLVLTIVAGLVWRGVVELRRRLPPPAAVQEPPAG